MQSNTRLEMFIFGHVTQKRHLKSLILLKSITLHSIFFHTATILSLKKMFTDIQTRNVFYKHFIIMTASCTACSECKIVVKASSGRQDQNPFYKRKSGQDEAQD